MRVLHLAEDAAFKRIRAARAAPRFPQIFDAIADGRLHARGVDLPAPHLTDDNAGELLAAAGHKSKAEIEALLAQSCPRPDVLTKLEPQPAPAGSPIREVAPGPRGQRRSGRWPRGQRRSGRWSWSVAIGPGRSRSLAICPGTGLRALCFWVPEPIQKFWVQ